MRSSRSTALSAIDTTTRSALEELSKLTAEIAEDAAWTNFGRRKFVVLVEHCLQTLDQGEYHEENTPIFPTPESEAEG